MNFRKKLVFLSIVCVGFMIGDAVHAQDGQVEQKASIGFYGEYVSLDEDVDPVDDQKKQKMPPTGNSPQRLDVPNTQGGLPQTGQMHYSTILYQTIGFLLLSYAFVAFIFKNKRVSSS